MSDNNTTSIELAKEANRLLSPDIRKLNITATLGGLAKNALDHGEEVTADALAGLGRHAATKEEGALQWLTTLLQLRKRDIVISGLGRANFSDLTAVDNEFTLKLQELQRRQTVARGSGAEKAPPTEQQLVIRERQIRAHAISKEALTALSRAEQAAGRDPEIYSTPKVGGALFSLVYTALCQAEGQPEKTPTVDQVVVVVRNLGLAALSKLASLRGRPGKGQRDIPNGSISDPLALLHEIEAREALYQSNKARTEPVAAE